MNFVLTALLLGIVAAEFPSNFKKCNRKDANFNACIAEAASDGIKQLIKPFPKLNIPNVDPLDIAQVTISPGSKGVVTIEQKFKDCKLSGISKIKITDFELTFNNKELILEAIIPDLKLQCNYELDGKVLVLPMRGKGRSAVDLYDVAISLHAFWDESKKGDQTAMKFSKETLTIGPEKVGFNFENLFDGDKVLGDELNKALNDNWQVIWDDVKSDYEKIIGSILIKLASDFFSTFSAEEAFD